MRDLVGYRVVAVHAHPDDEALFTGGTLADFARRGADVTVVTCTLGEEGEVIGERLAGLTVDEADQLGGARVRELDDSLAAMGARGVLLGGAGCFRDSGMEGSPAHEKPRALVNRVDEAAEKLRAELDVLRPDIVLTYGPDGGYGHPDHIAVHRLTHLAAEETPIWWCIYHRPSFYAALEDIDSPHQWRKPDKAYLDNYTNAEFDVELTLDDVALAAKRRALASHPTQIWLGEGTATATNPEAAWAVCHDPDTAPFAYALSNRLTMPVLRREHYQWGGKGAAPQSLLEGVRHGE